MFPGKSVEIGGETFVVPALSLGQLRNGVLAKLAEHDKLVEDGKTFDAFLVRGQVILEALRRNYPDFAEDRLWNFLDVHNTGPLWLTVLGASGFTPGEGEAATTDNDGTFAPSTAR